VLNFHRGAGLMNRDQHLLFGVIISIFVSVGIDGALYSGFVSVGYALIGGAIGSVFPDVIEPPRHWTHRRFFHSKTMFRYLLIGLVVMFIPSLFIPFLWFVFYIIFGYVFHLLADATTQMGLPD